MIYVKYKCIKKFKNNRLYFLVLKFSFTQIKIMNYNYKIYKIIKS